MSAWTLGAAPAVGAAVTFTDGAGRAWSAQVVALVVGHSIHYPAITLPIAATVEITGPLGVAQTFVIPFPV